jgi:hypothetical protein
MSLRDTPEYKSMNPFDAVLLPEDATETEQLAAWQYISDTGLWRHLEGWYGRRVSDLIDDGIIEPPANRP